MFATDSFLSAEVTYRADRVRQGWSSHRPTATSRRRKNDETPTAR